MGYPAHAICAKYPLAGNQCPFRLLPWNDQVGGRNDNRLAENLQMGALVCTDREITPMGLTQQTLPASGKHGVGFNTRSNNFKVEQSVSCFKVSVS